MSLTTEQRQLLHKALLSGFPTRAALRQLLDLHLDVTLESVTDNGPLGSAVVDLIRWAESQGRVEDLIRAAMTGAPENPSVVGLTQLLVSEEAPLEKSTFSLERLLERLPVGDAKLYGRDEEFDWLTGCYREKDAAVVVITAAGGIGKSALVRAWVKETFATVEKRPRFVGCSFWSQGTGDRAGTSEQFVLETLFALGDADAAKGSAWVRARRLARLLASAPTLLILDGLEPLQYGIDRLGTLGSIRDAGIRELLGCVVKEPGKVFCIVTSRVPVVHEALTEPGCVRRELSVLPPDAAIEYLRDRGLHGHEAAFADAAQYLGCHSLALVLAAEYLSLYEDGSIHRVRGIPLVSIATRAGRHAKSVMAAYEAAFRRDKNVLEAEVLRILGLFDRPVTWKCLKYLASAVPIRGFTAFGSVPLDDLREALARLQRWRLLSRTSETNLVNLDDAQTLDTHPLIREFFGDAFRSSNPEGWKDAHNRLYHYFALESTKLPETREDMGLLLQAAIHACKARMYCNALHQVYSARIMRGRLNYAVTQLAMLEPLLSVLSHFFREGDWTTPITHSANEAEGLHTADQVYLLCQVGFLLTATRGYSYDAVEQVFLLARELSEQLDDPVTQFEIGFGLWRYYAGRADLRASINTAAKLLAHAQDAGRSGLELVARRALATTAYWMGDFRKSRQEALAGLGLPQTEKQKLELLAEFGDDAEMNCKALLALSCWHLGLSGAEEWFQEVAVWARSCPKPHAKAVALFLSLYYADFCNDYPRALQGAEELIAISAEYGLTWWLAAGLLRRGWALAMLSAGRDGEDDLKEGFNLWQDAGALICVPYWKARHAEVLLARGDPDQALSVIEEGLAQLHQSGDRCWEPELYRLRAEVWLNSLGDDGHAEQDLRHAASVAAESGSVPLALRAAVSLARFYGKMGEPERVVRTCRSALQAAPGLQNCPEARELQTLLRDATSSP